MQLLHRGIAIADPARLDTVAREDGGLALLGDLDREFAHRCEGLEQFTRQHGARVATQARLRDVRDEATHPIGVGGNANRRHDRPQITGHGRLARQNTERVSFDGPMKDAEPLSVGEGETCRLGVHLQQPARRVTGGHASQPAHSAQVGAQILQLAMKVRAHVYSWEAEITDPTYPLPAQSKPKP